MATKFTIVKLFKDWYFNLFAWTLVAFWLNAILLEYAGFTLLGDDRAATTPEDEWALARFFTYILLPLVVYRVWRTWRLYTRGVRVTAEVIATGFHFRRFKNIWVAYEVGAVRYQKKVSAPQTVGRDGEVELLVDLKCPQRILIVTPYYESSAKRRPAGRG